MKKILTISILLFLLVSCFKNEEVVDLKIEESSATGEKIVGELGGISSGSGEITIFNTGVSSLDFNN